MDYPEKILVVLVAVTAVVISEALALQWRHVQFDEGTIRIEQASRLGEITTTLLEKFLLAVNRTFYEGVGDLDEILAQANS